MKLLCRQCRRAFDAEVGGECPDDGGVLLPADALEGHPDDPLLGALVAEKYAVVGFIGEGGFGTVYRAIQRPVGRPVALKVIGAAHAGDETLRARFFREARVVGRLTHPAAVHLYDYGEHDGRLFMALELVRGRELSAVLRREGPLPPARAVHIARQILAALGDAHDLGLVHRDLKPDNVMLLGAGADERVKVLDFGIAKVLDPERGEDPITSETVIIGTPAYLSPEQARGQEVGPPSDLYSLGVMLHEMLSGERPYSAPTAVGLLTAHLTEPIPVLEEVPDGLAGAVQKALAKEWTGRFTSAAEMSEALATAVETPVGHVSTPAETPGARAFDATAPTEAIRTPTDPASGVAPEPGPGDDDEPRLPTISDRLTDTMRRPGTRWGAVVVAVLAGALLVWSLLPEPPPPPDPVVWTYNPARLPLQGQVLASGPVVVSVSPDRNLVATLSENRRVDLWGVGGGGWGGALAVAEPAATAVALAPDWSSYAWATVQPDRTHAVHVQPPGGEVRTWAGHPWPVESILYSPDGARLAIVTRKGELKRWRPANPEGEKLDPVAHPKALAFSGDGEVLAAGYEDGRVQAWADVGVAVEMLREPVRYLAVDPRGRAVLAVGEKSVRVGGQGSVVELPHEVTAFAFDRERGRVALGDAAGGVTLVHFEEGVRDRLPRHAGPVTAVALDGDRAASASGGEVCAWDIGTGASTVAKVHAHPIRQLLIPPGADWLLTSAADWKARLVAFDPGSWIEDAGPRVWAEGEVLRVGGVEVGSWPAAELDDGRLRRGLDRQLSATMDLGGPYGAVRVALRALRAAGATQVGVAETGQRLPRIKLRDVGDPAPTGRARLLVHISAQGPEVLVSVGVQAGADADVLRLRDEGGCPVARVREKGVSARNLRRKAVRALLQFRHVDARGLRTLRADHVLVRAAAGVRWAAVVGAAAAASDVSGGEVVLELGDPALDAMDCPGAVSPSGLAAGRGGARRGGPPPNGGAPRAERHLTSRARRLPA